LRGFFCRPFPGSLFWRAFFSLLWPRRCHFHADLEHGWRLRDQLHWKETPAWPFLVCLFSLQRVLRGATHSHVGISKSPIGLVLISSPWSPRICAGTHALRLELCKLKFACSHSTGNFLRTFFCAMSLWCRQMHSPTGSSPAQTGPLAQDSQLTSSQVPHVPLGEVSRTACEDGVLLCKEEVVMNQTKHTHCGVWRLLITFQSQEAQSCRTQRLLQN